MEEQSLLYDEEDILERVDEYTLYCHYLGYEPMIGAKYPSPIRPGDDDPSFGIYERKFGHGVHEFMWKDQAIGLHGDIFDLVSQSFSPHLTRWQSKQQVCADFNFGGIQQGSPKLIQYEAQYAPATHIRIISRAFNTQELMYWKQYNITPPILQRYNVTALKSYFLTDDQLTPSYPRGLGFGYRIWNKYQLYFPKAEKRRKFRNDWTELCVPGFLQLEYNQPLCIITKSYKDVMCLRSLGYEAVSPRGENILLPKECIAHLKSKYRRVVTLFDNDGKHKAAEYPFEELHIPIETNQKDPTDYCSANGAERTQELLSLILNS